jgi:glycosyltransferase involved in cell wall biosynthesis
MDKTMISVIIPCYNQGKFIDNAVESVLAQTFQKFEIIIINDGSTDAFTIDKIKNYNKSKTRVIHTENQGLASARNTGFQDAIGEYIQFLDADDTILPTKFEEQLNVFELYPETDVCYTNFINYDLNKDSVLEQSRNEFLGNNPLNDFLFRWERDLCIPIHTALFRKTIWVEKLPFNKKLRAREDWFMWCDLSVINTKFYYLNKILAVYNYHEDNMSKDTTFMCYTFSLAAFYILQIIPSEKKEEFLHETIKHINKTLENKIYPNLVIEISDLRNKFIQMDKTIDYKIGNLFLKPYRFFKTKVFGKRYL